MNDKVMGGDYEFAEIGADREFAQLERLFGPLEHIAADDRYSEFDFKNENVYIEFKRRRNTKHKHPTTMVDEDKVVKGFELQLARKRVFFAFDFVDVLCLWELNRDEYEVLHAGHSESKIKSCCHIHTNYLMDIKEHANQITAERPQSGLHHQETVHETSIEDAGRNHPPQQKKEEEAWQKVADGEDY